MAPSSLTHPEWNHETGGLEVARAFPDRIKGKKVLITGVSPESIGSSIALSIASQSPELLLLASRTTSKLEQVVGNIRHSHPDVHIALVSLDLMSQDSIKAAAAQVTILTDRLDLIINNAAIMTQERLRSEEGIEGQFATCHIGHFLLTNLLMPQILSAAKSNPPGATRIINVSSLGHLISPIRFSDYNITGKHVPPEERNPAPLPPMFSAAKPDGYNGWMAYGQAKTANILFSLSLTEKLKNRGVASYALHPGSISTGLSRNLDAQGDAAIRNMIDFWKNHDQGAATVLVAALDPALDDSSKGIMLSDCQIYEPAPWATDSATAERLWILSETLVKRDFKL
ncbi:hypothetical protein ACEQ8H_002477 [Pleosporales sp. CAS-2024a]